MEHSGTPHIISQYYHTVNTHPPFYYDTISVSAIHSRKKGGIKMKHTLRRLTAFLSAAAICGTALYCPSAVFMASAAVEGIAIDEVNFPDAVFREYVDAEFDTTDDGMLTATEIAQVSGIFVHGLGITDLTGIAHFTNLIWLDCSNNQLTSLDVSNNTWLMDLSCEGNQLTELDLQFNSQLHFLGCTNNHLHYLDLSNNYQLIHYWYDDTVEVSPPPVQTTEPIVQTTAYTTATMPAMHVSTGATTNESTTTTTTTTTHYGDVNCDGEVDIRDTLLLNKNLLLGQTLSEQGILNADVDCDGKPTSTDALAILQYTVSLITVLPV
jgi:hypothetical protein